MHISEVRINPTLINCVIKEYEFKWRPLGSIRQYWLPQNSFMKLNEHPTIENQLPFDTLYNYNKTQGAPFRDQLSTVCSIPLN